MSKEMPTPVDNQPQPDTQAQPAHGLKQKVGAAVMTALIAPGIGGSMLEKGHEGSAVHRPEPTVEQVDTTTTIPVDGINKYQEDFETDQQDAEVTQGAIHDIVADNLELIKNLPLGEKIQITGLASAEDQGTGVEQLTQPSLENKNLELANQRGLLGVAAFINEVKAQTGIDLTGRVELGAREDSFTPEEVAKAQALAKEHIFGDVEKMINLYNQDPASVPQEVSQFLDKKLAERRGFELTIPGTKTVIKESPRKTAEKEARTEGQVFRYEGYLPPEVVVERPGSQIYEKRRQREKAQARSSQVAYKRQQPARGNGNTKSYSQSTLKNRQGRQGGSSMNQTGAGGGSGRGSRSR